MYIKCQDYCIVHIIILNKAIQFSKNNFELIWMPVTMIPLSIKSGKKFKRNQWQLIIANIQNENDFGLFIKM